MVRYSLMVAILVGFLGSLAAPGARGATTEEQKCSKKKMKISAQYTRDVSTKCFVKEVQKQTEQADCIAKAFGKFQTRMGKIDGNFPECPTNDQTTSKTLLELYARKAADVGISFFEDLGNPCGTTQDTYSFQVTNGQEIRVAADTTNSADAADLKIDVDCGGGAQIFSANDETACTYAPADGTGCPDNSVTATVTGTCNLTVSVVNAGSCKDAAKTSYRLVVTTDKAVPSQFLLTDDQ